jgi:hypothetical protein
LIVGATVSWLRAVIERTKCLSYGAIKKTTLLYFTTFGKCKT